MRKTNLDPKQIWTLRETKCCPPRQVTQINIAIWLIAQPGKYMEGNLYAQQTAIKKRSAQNGITSTCKSCMLCHQAFCLFFFPNTESIDAIVYFLLLFSQLGTLLHDLSIEHLVRRSEPASSESICPSCLVVCYFLYLLTYRSNFGKGLEQGLQPVQRMLLCDGEMEMSD